MPERDAFELDAAAGAVTLSLETAVFRVFLRNLNLEKKGIFSRKLVAITLDPES